MQAIPQPAPAATVTDTVASATWPASVATRELRRVAAGAGGHGAGDLDRSRLTGIERGLVDHGRKGRLDALRRQTRARISERRKEHAGHRHRSGRAIDQRHFRAPDLQRAAAEWSAERALRQGHPRRQSQARVAAAFARDFGHSTSWQFVTPAGHFSPAGQRLGVTMPRTQPALPGPCAGVQDTGGRSTALLRRARLLGPEGGGPGQEKLPLP